MHRGKKNEKINSPFKIIFRAFLSKNKSLWNFKLTIVILLSIVSTSQIFAFKQGDLNKLKLTFNQITPPKCGKCDLREVNLSDADLSGAKNLSDANLGGAIMKGVIKD